MGQSLSQQRTPSRDPLPNPPDHQVMEVFEGTSSSSSSRKSRKRKTTEGEKEAESKKVAKLNTCAYVYEKLFVQGEDSDVKLEALGREWNVHKLYLKQTKFFDSMFRSGWLESKSSTIHLEITDPNIDGDGLNAVLGALYHNEIEIDIEKIEGTVAAASYVMLDSVTDRCAEMMIDSLGTSNAIRFYDLSLKYGLDSVRGEALNLMLHNFWRMMKNKETLREIDHQLLLTLLTSPDLLLIEGEFDLYKVVRTWIFMQENPDCRPDEKPEVFSRNVSRFFKTAFPDSIFLKYTELISCLRIEHFLNCSETIKVVKADRLIPHSIIEKILSSLWISLLENEETPKSLDIDDESFSKRCFRLGRSLDSFPKCWRWIGYNLGVDLLLHVNDYSICIKRNCLNQRAPYSVNLKSNHVLHYRLVICDSNGRVIHDSKKTTLEMKPDEAKTIFRLPEDVTPPISVHLQYLIHAPVLSFNYYIKKFLEDEMAVKEE